MQKLFAIKLLIKRFQICILEVKKTPKLYDMNDQLHSINKKWERVQVNISQILCIKFVHLQPFPKAQ